MARPYPNIRRIPRDIGTEPGAVSPQAWDAMVSYCEELARRVASLTPQSSPDIGVKHTPSGFTSHLKRRGGGGSGGAVRGAFYTIYTVVSEDATNGDIMLTGGQVTAGSGTETVPAFVLYDASVPAWAGAAGDILQLAINGEGEEVDDVLMPVFNQDTGGSDLTTVSVIADNILPEVGALSGLCNVNLGVFTATGFTPSNVGNIQVSFCYGGFTVSRF